MLQLFKLNIDTKKYVFGKGNSINFWGILGVQINIVKKTPTFTRVPTEKHGGWLQSFVPRPWSFFSSKIMAH